MTRINDHSPALHTEIADSLVRVIHLLQEMADGENTYALQLSRVYRDVAEVAAAIPHDRLRQNLERVLRDCISGSAARAEKISFVLDSLADQVAILATALRKLDSSERVGHSAGSKRSKLAKRFPIAWNRR
jgi:hypothetical protein